MKRILAALFCLTIMIGANAQTGFSSFKGVWAASNAEAVITDSVCIVYYRADSTLQTVLEIPAAGILHKTVFAPGGSVSFPSDVKPLEITKTDGKIDINGITLKKVEDIETVTPYEMSKCESKLDVGKCLQEWRLGVGYADFDGKPYCEVNTNRHMFVYMVNASMIYIRAAATRNNNNGTLFFQNIRMMKNGNTGEYTMEMMPDNYKIAKNNLEIDNSKFQKDRCTFSPDGGIYWSLISFTPGQILINGCGEIYNVDRPTPQDDFKEWIKFVPYSSERENILPF